MEGGSGGGLGEVRLLSGYKPSPVLPSPDGRGSSGSRVSSRSAYRRREARPAPVVHALSRASSPAAGPAEPLGSSRRAGGPGRGRAGEGGPGFGSRRGPFRAGRRAAHGALAPVAGDAGATSRDGEGALTRLTLGHGPGWPNPPRGSGPRSRPGEGSSKRRRDGGHAPDRASPARPSERADVRSVTRRVGSGAGCTSHVP